VGPTCHSKPQCSHGGSRLSLLHPPPGSPSSIHFLFPSSSSTTTDRSPRARRMERRPPASGVLSKLVGERLHEGASTQASSLRRGRPRGSLDAGVLTGKGPVRGSADASAFSVSQLPTGVPAQPPEPFLLPKLCARIRPHVARRPSTGTAAHHRRR
jgi:hypothetical protein